VAAEHVGQVVAVQDGGKGEAVADSVEYHAV
jgi:hypothetical protein